VQAAVGAGVVCLLLSAVGGNQVRPTAFEPRFFPYPALAAWGKDVQRVVPPGSQLLVPPSAAQLRIATRRGVVVDCKLAPYGGDAWREYRSRMEALGGFTACNWAGFQFVTPDQLAALAGRYGAGYLVLRTDQPADVDAATALTAQGWTPVAGERPGAPYRVLKAPWEG
jgi:hypothetical protein